MSWEEDVSGNTIERAQLPHSLVKRKVLKWVVALALSFAAVTLFTSSEALVSEVGCFRPYSKNRDRMEIFANCSEREPSNAAELFQILYLPEPQEKRVEFLIFTFYTLSHLEMHKLTVENKLSYARQHGYGVVSSIIEQRALSEMGGFAVCGQLRETFVRFPHLSWLVVVGADHVIMNPIVKLEDVVKGDAASIIVSAEASVINLGMYFLRNSNLGRSFMETMCAAKDLYKTHVWFDNQFVIEAWNANGMMRKSMSMLPQRAFNSYLAGAYGANYAVDAVLKCSTSYQPGDFMIHFPGMGLDTKMGYIKDFLSKVTPVDGIEPRTLC